MQKEKEEVDLLAVQEAGRKEKEELVMRVKVLAEQDPGLVKSVGFLVSQPLHFQFSCLYSSPDRSTAPTQPWWAACVRIA